MSCHSLYYQNIFNDLINRSKCESEENRRIMLYNSTAKTDGVLAYSNNALIEMVSYVDYILSKR